MLFCSVLVGRTARADPSRVRVVRASDADTAVREATTRLEAELVAAGFVVDLEEQTATDPRGEVESGGAPSYASIAVLQSGSDAVADVWVVDQLSGKTLIRRVDAGAEPGPTRARTLAIRAVELLRASLLAIGERPREAKPASHTVPVDVAHRIEPIVVPRHAFAAWSVEIGAAMSLTKGFGPAVGPSAWISRSVATDWIVGARWIGPTSAPELRSPVASADGRQMMLLAEVRRTFGNGRLTPLVTVGLGAVDTSVSGHAASPLQAHTEHALSAAFHASLGLHLRIVERVGIALDTGVLSIAPARPIRIVGEDVGNSSPLSWLSSFGLVTSFD